MTQTAGIRMTSRADEVQDILGFRDEQWHRFYWLTKQEARKLLELYPECQNYKSFSATEQIQLLDRINGELAKDGIPTITALVLRWRMSSLIREMRRRQNRTPTAKKAQSVDGATEKAPNKPFDPIRDI